MHLRWLPSARFWTLRDGGLGLPVTPDSVCAERRQFMFLVGHKAVNVLRALRAPPTEDFAPVRLRFRKLATGAQVSCYIAHSKSLLEFMPHPAVVQVSACEAGRKYNLAQSAAPF